LKEIALSQFILPLPGSPSLLCFSLWPVFPREEPPEVKGTPKPSLTAEGQKNSSFPSFLVVPFFVTSLPQRAGRNRQMLEERAVLAVLL